MGVKRLRVAVDTGGTFTDFVVLDERSGALEVFKVPSTRGHEADGIIGGLHGYLARSGAEGRTSCSSRTARPSERTLSSKRPARARGS